MMKDTSNTIRDPHRWVVFLTICLVYFFVYFHRVSTSVIVSDLVETFKIDATALGFMSSMYFYLYALVQPLVGHLTDRIGPRRVIGWWSITAAAGCILFGLAPSIGWATVGRGLIGFGVAGVYVPAIKAFSLWFQKKDFATMVGFLLSVGNLGAVIATTPLAWAAGTFGWRPTFFLIGGVTLALALITLFFTRDYKSPSTGNPAVGPPVPEEKPVPQPGFLKVLASVDFWIIAMIFFGIYGTLVTLQGLWATQFLMTILNVDRIYASNLNMVIPIGVIVGAPAIGWFSDRFSLKKAKVLIGIVVVYALTWAGILFFGASLRAFGMAAVFMVMGMAIGGFITVLWGLVRETTPSGILGLTSGMLNPAPFFGVAAFQVLTGAILDRAGRINNLYSLSGFKSAFLACLACILICLVLSIYLQRRIGRRSS
jgi:sugar phosphate permease